MVATLSPIYRWQPVFLVVVVALSLKVGVMEVMVWGVVVIGAYQMRVISVIAMTDQWKYVGLV